MNLTLIYYGNNKFYGKYAYTESSSFNNDSFTITENGAGLLFKVSEIPPDIDIDALSLRKAAGGRREDVLK